MSSTLSIPASAEPPESDEEALARQLHMLKNLSVLGMDYCAYVHAHRPVQAGPHPTSQEAKAALDNARVFAVLDRSTRQAISLDARLRELRARRAIAATAAAKIEAEENRLSRHQELRGRLEPALRTAPPEHARALRNRFEHRLNDWDITQDLARDRLDHAIARLARELKLTPLVYPPSQPSPPPSG